MKHLATSLFSALRTSASAPVFTALLGLGGVSMTSSDALAQGLPCGGIRTGEGVLSFNERLAVDAVNTEAGQACIAAVAAELQRRSSLQSVTIAARVPNDKTMREKGQAAAANVADALGKAGVPRNLISTVVPTARPDEKDAIYVAFTERRSARTVAQLEELSGVVSAGHKLGGLREATAGQLLTSSDFVETGGGSVAVLRLLDGSRVHLSENTILRIGQVEVESSGRRNVRVHLIKGQGVVYAAEREGPFYLVTNSAIAGVRGTVFRLNQVEEKKTRIETLDGMVTFGGTRNSTFVSRGKGSRIDYRATPEEPRTLLISPQAKSPLRGTAREGAFLTWVPVAEAENYQVEIAENAQFTKGWRTYEAKGDSFLIPDSLTPGKWFWRVTPIDVDGFHGYSSKVYAFDYVP